MLASRARHVAPPLLRALAAQAPFGGSAVRLGSAGAAGGAAEAPPRPPAAPPPPAAVPPAVGASYSVTKTFSAADVAAFTALSGDANPIHTDPASAAAAQLPGCILPGLLSASLFPGIIGSAFPGAVYVTQTLRFKRYALVGDTLTATVTVEKASGRRVSFQTLCRRESGQGGGGGEVVVEGTALALIPQQAQQAQHESRRG